MKRTLLVGFSILLAAGCKTTGTSSEVRDNQNDFRPNPVDNGGSTLLALNGGDAVRVYDALTLEDNNGVKQIRRDLVVYCVQEGGLPPGAQGFPGPSRYSCTMTAHVVFPPGAQGLPGRPFLDIQGEAARAFYSALQLEERYENGVYVKNYTGDMSFQCSEGGRLPPGAQGFPAPASCELTKESGGQDRNDSSLLALEGDEAREVYDALTLEDRNGVKQISRDLVVYCVSEGGLPPGAQGFPGPSRHSCTMNSRVVFPAGAQGLPPRPFLDIQGSAATAFYNALQIEEQYQDGVYVKSKSGNMSFQCSESGGLPPGAQGFPGPTTYSCSLEQ